jgi:uncharacterized surface protein with fasciclin (FAS1) repeats
MASNGIIHVIDKVLLPPEDDAMTSDEPAESSASPVATPATTDEGPGTIVDIAVANEDFTTLVAAVTAAGLVETLARDGPFTVFAPTNEAFDSLPEGTVDTLLLPENIDQLTDILKYHVVSGSVPSSSLKGDVETLNGDSITVTVDVGLMLNDDANVITADIMASNGIIHVIDKVLLPPEDDAMTSNEPAESSASPVATPATTDEELGTIVDIAVANEDFSIVVAAVTAAGLVETLAGEGPFTVFAPTNDAFGSLPEGFVDTLLLPENIDQLIDILKYHVVSGSVPSSSLESGDVETLNGDSIAVDVSDDMGIMLNDDAHVITADIMASNGIIHVIDKVLLPPEDDALTGSAAEESVIVAPGISSATSTWLVSGYVILFICALFYIVPL